MKYTILLSLLLYFLFAASGNEFFDDFNYESSGDTLLRQHDWTVVHGVNAPPSGANYSRDLVTFEPAQPGSNNRLMILGARTNGEIANIAVSRIETPAVFREGIFAARVFFDHAPHKTQDGNIRAFYLISPLHFPSDTLYSECDIEYLSYNVWETSGDTRSTVYFNTWETYQTEPYIADHALNSQQINLSGWHILIIQISGGHVSYFLDKSDEPLFVHKYSPAGSTVYPESLMHLAFANWITSTSNEFTRWRKSNLRVDWVYHAADTTLNFVEIRQRINELQKNNILYLNEFGE
ncbi:MAG: hypothetical protein DRP93_00775 [Candidatus Neomarinimicrobiota bacterium]|nr:MAG: hypothetical protein DRP93_00775 [Candidatus Neomarinimicrobiota bacterium]